MASGLAGRVPHRIVGLNRFPGISLLAVWERHGFTLYLGQQCSVRPQNHEHMSAPRRAQELGGCVRFLPRSAGMGTKQLPAG